jgi:glycosyltransferase involved in cell wall biosynthesis
MSTISVVIPALNERDNVEAVIRSIPVTELRSHGWDTEILLVDNGSTDGTAELARAVGARVLVQPVRGYGNAYKAGFANAVGEVIATGDADLSYPFEILPRLLSLFQGERLDFLTTNRLRFADRRSMKSSHRFGNVVLTQSSRALLKLPFMDSQSGMWMFRRRILGSLDLRSPGMAFSQEIKHEAVARGFRCGEVPIDYRPRGGDVKLNPARDGLRNLGQLALHRLRTDRQSRPAVIDLRAYEAQQAGYPAAHISTNAAAHTAQPRIPDQETAASASSAEGTDLRDDRHVDPALPLNATQ